MIFENKKRVREEIAKRKDWVVIDGILGEEINALAWGKDCQIIYEDMDGQPCKCEAKCEYKPFNGSRFRAINGPAKGNIMCGVIAYRILEEDER